VLDFDVAVVGAGPAGSWAAYRLAKAGARVALVDGTHPREKPCGGGVTMRAFDVVRGALTARAMPAVAVRTVLFGENGRTTAAVSLAPQSQVLVTSRREFDGALRDAALAAGAHPVVAQARDVARSTNGWTVHLRDGRVTAGWLLGADGANSLVRRRVSRPFARADLSIASGYYLDEGRAADIRIVFERDPPGYLWSFPRPDHVAVGVCAPADVASSRSLLQRARDWTVRELAADPRTLRRYSWPIPSLEERALRAERYAGKHWMLLGDAAGLVDPITREGIYFALISGTHAADSLLTDGDPSSAYTARLSEDVREELVRAARVKGMFFRPQFTSLLVAALQRSSAIRHVMADLVAGRQTYRGLRRRLLRTCEVGLMLKLLSEVRSPKSDLGHWTRKTS
jgi:geranylgeranyl reductase family protein